MECNVYVGGCWAVYQHHSVSQHLLAMLYLVLISYHLFLVLSFLILFFIVPGTYSVMPATMQSLEFRREVPCVPLTKLICTGIIDSFGCWHIMMPHH